MYVIFNIYMPGITDFISYNAASIFNCVENMIFGQQRQHSEDAGFFKGLQLSIIERSTRIRLGVAFIPLFSSVDIIVSLGIVFISFIAKI